MRIIAGAAKGRRLEAPRTPDTRPITDRAKESIFSSLGDRVSGARVLDLYAGSGAFGLEALSRGSASAEFVERGREAVGVLRRNVESTGLGGRIVADDVVRFLERNVDTYDLIFVDPPYALSLASVEQVIGLVEPLLDRDGVVVLHRRVGSDLPGVPQSLRIDDDRRLGDSRVLRYLKETR
ncbi:MAG TPA: 16S rRNA (guanine(966)-N(2))-methyltransferase RsmD [Acidimicrobiia bacterium]|jgi:16S rRNA (guanine966-N2)-methyltransferase|nr:16S rRNA (guanine(966)-N(2))-methyltransferase RsmD [Acidimicrobiia bacterium]